MRLTRLSDASQIGKPQYRMLDAAESLFIRQGFEATGLRQITATAKVNLAAVNYHFESKEGLFRAVLARRFDPLNEERLKLLDALERDARGKPLGVEQILWAMFVPALHLSRDPKRGGRNFLRLLGRAYVDPAPFLRDFLSARYMETTARFKKSFAAALPSLSKHELNWRLHFTFGAMAYAIAGTDIVDSIISFDASTDNDGVLLQRLLPFLAAGLNVSASALRPLDEIVAL